MTGMGDEVGVGSVSVETPSVPRPGAIGGFVAAQLPYVTLAAAGGWLWYVYAGHIDTATLRFGIYSAGGVVLAVAWALIALARGGVWHVASLFHGEDHRPSTSLFQAFVWTVATVYAYVGLYAARLSWGTTDPLTAVPSNLLAAMGLSVGTAVAARAITASQVASGQVTKTDGAAQGADGPTGVSAVVLDDDGDTNLAKVHMLLWTFVAVGIFLIATLQRIDLVLRQGCTSPCAAGALPDIDTSLLMLMGVGQGTYLGHKLASAPAASSPNG